jgi:hypothetical protein
LGYEPPFLVKNKTTQWRFRDKPIAKILPEKSGTPQTASKETLQPISKDA